MVKGKVVRARHFFCISSGLINVFVFVGLEVNENINVRTRLVSGLEFVLGQSCLA